MSLDITSHPGRPGPDELVPSRYALRVGEIDVLVVSDGVMPIAAQVLGTNVDPAVLKAGTQQRPILANSLARVFAVSARWGRSRGIAFSYKIRSCGPGAHPMR